MSYCYEYPRAAITVDAVVLCKSPAPQLLLIERKYPPFKGCWAFPGGFVDMSETLEVAVQRELFEETNLFLENLEQFAAYSRVDRDPRGRAITVVFTAFLEQIQTPLAKDDASAVGWFSLGELPSLAFDHSEILKDILRAKKIL